MGDNVSYFDSEKNYYIFKYIVDPVTGEPTDYEGEVQAFVKATNPWEACEKAGFDDPNAYGANLIENPKTFEEEIKKERKHLSKISKQLKPMIDEIEAEREKFLKERPCPNGCGQLDENFSCSNCGYGHEAEELVKDLEKMIKEEKKKGNDTSQLESIRDSINQADINSYKESHDENGEKLG